MKYPILFIIIISVSLGACFSQVPTDGLISYFPFNGVAVDIESNAQVEAVNGAILTTDRFGIDSSAYLFDGTDDYIEIGNFNELNPDNRITFSLWAQAIANTSNCMLMLYPDNNSDRCVTCAQYKGSIYWDYGDIFENGRMHVENIPFDTLWHHYVYQLDYELEIKQVYMDGVLLGSDSNYAVLSDINRSLWIGGGTDANPGNIRFHGSIDDIRIYNRLLDDAEVLNLYHESGFMSYCEIFDTLWIFDTIQVFDTTWVIVYDSLAVTDTLIIEAMFTDLVSEELLSRIKVYPNPARNRIFINTGENYSRMSGYSIRIVDPSGILVFITAINKPLFELSVDDLGCPGLYILQIIDSKAGLIAKKKILLR